MQTNYDLPHEWTRGLFHGIFHSIIYQLALMNFHKKKRINLNYFQLIAPTMRIYEEKKKIKLFLEEIKLLRNEEKVIRR